MSAVLDRDHNAALEILKKELNFRNQTTARTAGSDACRDPVASMRQEETIRLVGRGS